MDENEINTNSAVTKTVEQTKNKTIAVKHIGHEDVKVICHEATVFYLDNIREYSDSGINANKGILLYGQSGTGKSSLAQEVALDVQNIYGKELIDIVNIQFHDLASCNVGVASKKIQDFFDNLKKNPKFKILLMDEMESLAPERHKAGVLATERTDALLKHIDYLPNTFIFGMTNHKEKVDKAFLRDGRLGDYIEVYPPTDEDKKEFVRRWLNDGRVKYESNVDLNIFVRHYGMVGADFRYLENRLFTQYLKKGKKPLSAQDICMIDANLVNKLNARSDD